MNHPFFKTNIGKTVTAAVYVALSAVLNYVITAIAGDPELFGPSTALINILLVLVQKTFFDARTPNL